MMRGLESRLAVWHNYPRLTLLFFGPCTLFLAGLFMGGAVSTAQQAFIHHVKIDLIGTTVGLLLGLGTLWFALQGAEVVEPQRGPCTSLDTHNLPSLKMSAKCRDCMRTVAQLLGMEAMKSMSAREDDGPALITKVRKSVKKSPGGKRVRKPA